MLWVINHGVQYFSTAAPNREQAWSTELDHLQKNPVGVSAIKKKQQSTKWCHLLTVLRHH